MHQCRGAGFCEAVVRCQIQVDGADSIHRAHQIKFTVPCEVAKIDRSNRYTLIVSVVLVPEFADLPENFETVVYDKRSKTGLAQFACGIFLHRLGADLYHIPLNAVPLLMPKPYVVTIHDMSSLLFGSELGYRNNLRRFYLRRGLLRADRVMAVSTATQRDVESVSQADIEPSAAFGP